MDAAVVVWLVVGLAAALLLVILAPWRSPRRDALDEEEYYAVLSGEAPDDGKGA